MLNVLTLQAAAFPEQPARRSGYDSVPARPTAEWGVGRAKITAECGVLRSLRSASFLSVKAVQIVEHCLDIHKGSPLHHLVRRASHHHM